MNLTNTALNSEAWSINVVEPLVGSNTVVPDNNELCAVTVATVLCSISY